MDVGELSMIHHVAVVFTCLWFLSCFGISHPLAYFLSFIYLYLVHDRFVVRLRRKLQFQERKQAHQKRVLCDSETVRWLNHAVEQIWPICMEQIASQKILLPIIPWFLEKYKPWTAREAKVLHMYLGRNPPMFTEMRVLRHSDDDHLVLELGMNFYTADDMSGILAVKLRKRLGFGMWTKLHITGMHVEGKVLVGIKFLRQWPFLGRLRVCFAEPPYFQMTVKPIFTHGVDVTELPGIAGWLDKLLSVAFEQTLVQPNMLVVDVEKFVAPQPENWFSVNVKEPVAYAKVEVIEASDIKPSDLNGLADPYVKGQLGPYRFRTKIQKRTLAPKWIEEFKIPIVTWESPNVLSIEVRDKDTLFDDSLGACTLKINDLKDGERHDMWLPLQNIKMGRLHVAVTVVEESVKEAIAKEVDNVFARESWSKEEMQGSFASDANRGSFASVSTTTEKSPRVADNFEAINIEGQEKTGVWIHHPGSEVSQVWEPRKGRSRQLDGQISIPSYSFVSTNPKASATPDNDSSTCDENDDAQNPNNPVLRGLRKIGSVFHRNQKNENNSSSGQVFHRNHKNEDISSNDGETVLLPYANIRSVDEKEIGVKFIVEDGLSVPGTSSSMDAKTANLSPEGGSGRESPSKGNAKDKAKNMFKHAGKSVKHALSRKGSRKSQADSSIVAEHGIDPELDSSDDESLISPKDQSAPAIPIPLSCCTGSGDSEKSEGSSVQADSGEREVKMEDEVKKTHAESLPRIDENKASVIDGHDNVVVGSSKPSSPEENLEREKENLEREKK